MTQLIVRASDISRCRRAAKIHKNMQNTAKFGRNLIKYTSVQHIWNFSQLLGLFTYRKLVHLSWNFVTETCKQCPKTPKLPGVDYVAIKLGTNHDVKGFAIGSVLESTVVERANDDLCLKNIKKAGLVSAKPIFLWRSFPWEITPKSAFFHRLIFR